MPVSAENSQEDQVNYRHKYKNLKRKLKFLVCEQECFQEELRKSQRKLLKINRDKSFLLDRLLQYECIDQSSSDSEETASSDNASDTEGQKVTGTEGSKHKKKTAPYAPMFNPSTMSGMFGPLGYPQTGAMTQPMMAPTMAGFAGYFPSAQRVKSESPGPGRPRKQQQRPKKSSTKSSKSKAAKEHGDSKGQLSSLQMPGPPSATVPHELFSGGTGNPESEPDAPMDESMSSQSLPSDLDDAYDGDDNLVIDIPE
ncbi:INO80 complex subunit E-like [Branchiostoma floridae]|uniref:INO80 complex subunit E-like n=1 Tax=Branchiostoma floridae TaxID=7739 RepID=A0A9J7N5W7_BRAFL|nr:INO80 complex subunit E-like [Branchiostoma floridae]